MPTGTLRNPDDLKALLDRLERLRPDSKPAWGTLDAPRLLCHLADSLRVGLGDLAAVPRHTPIGRTLGRFVVVHTGFQPPPGKVKTAPEMPTSTPTNWSADLENCRRLATRVGAGEAHREHPSFGPLTADEWGKLAYKHMSYHLRQFGV